MIARGQLSRLHEISVDGLTWLPVATVPGLFDPVENTAIKLTQELAARIGRDRHGLQADDVEGGNADRTQGAENGTAQQAVWYFGGSEMTIGPVSADRIAALTRQGELSGESFVWRKGMHEWEKIVDVPELAKHVNFEEVNLVTSHSGNRLLPTSTGKNYNEQNRENMSRPIDNVQHEIVFQVTQAIPWLTCLAITMAVFGGTLLITGARIIGKGLFDENWLQAAWGPLWLICGVASYFVVWSLMQYRAKLIVCRVHSSLLALAIANKKLNRLWCTISLAALIVTQIWIVWLLFDFLGANALLNGK
jgi:hypothetical protein